MRDFYIAACIAVALVGAQADAASPQKRSAARPVRRPAPKPDPVRMLVGAIAMNTVTPGDNLFAACQRSDFKTLAWGLEGAKSKISIEKSEYETAAEFAKRSRELEDLVNQQGEVVVCQPLDDNEDAPFTYNAEREVFAGSFDAHQNVWRDVKQTGSYVSKTRMGVRATVTASIELEYDVSFGSALQALKTNCLKGSYSFSYEVPVPRAEAPLMKARGYLVFTGRLISPFISSSDSPGEPTLDNPHDVYERTLTVYFSPKAAAVVAPDGQQRWTCALVWE